MSSYPKLKHITYSDAARILHDLEVQEDLVDSFSRLGHVMTTAMDRFEAISKQMHSIDMRLRTTFRPKWEALRKEVSELLWQFRSNYYMISGRLKLFCNTVLPMAAQNVDRTGTRKGSLGESVQMLQYFSSLSVEHATATRNLVDRTARMNRGLISFLVEFLRVTTRHTTSGVEEMAKLSQKITEVQMIVQQMFTSTAELREPNVIHLVYVCSRFVGSSGRGSRSKLRRPIVLESDLSDLGQLYDTFDQKRNEMAHTQYTTQLRQNRSDPVTFAQNQFFAFVQELILTSESALTLSVALWSRLRVDCGLMFRWLTGHSGGDSQFNIPPIVATYLESQSTVYMPLTSGMDAYVASIDASPYVNAEDSSS